MINTQVTDIAWLTRRLQGTQQANIKAEDVDEFEEDVTELIGDIELNESRKEARLRAFDSLLVRLKNKDQS
jgi:hypothetical protein